MICKKTKLLLHLKSLDLVEGGGGGSGSVGLHYFYSETVSKIIS